MSVKCWSVWECPSHGQSILGLQIVRHQTTSDEYRSLEAVNAGGRSADSAHMISQARPEQNMSFTDMLMAPPDRGICDFYTSASEMQLA